MGFLDSLFRGFQDTFGGLGNAAGALFGGGGGGKQQMSPGNGSMGAFGMGNMPLGLGLMAGSQLFGGKTKAPDLNTPDVQALRNFSSSPPVLPQSMQDEINASLGINEEQQLRNLRDVYKNARPGTDYTTDSAYQRDLSNMQRGLASNRANAMMQPTLQYQQPQLQNLSNIAGNSINQQVMQAAMRAQQQSQTKNLLSGLGGMFVNKAMYPQGMFGGAMSPFKIPGF